MKSEKFYKDLVLAEKTAKRLISQVYLAEELRRKFKPYYPQFVVDLGYLKNYATPGNLYVYAYVDEETKRDYQAALAIDTIWDLFKIPAAKLDIRLPKTSTDVMIEFKWLGHPVVLVVFVRHAVCRIVEKEVTVTETTYVCD